MELSIKVLVDSLDCWNIHLNGGIVYKSAGGTVWTAGTSARVMESSRKVLEDHYGVLEHPLEWWNRL